VRTPSRTTSRSRALLVVRGVCNAQLEQPGEARAQARKWTIVRTKNDWNAVFPER
jgi:hypothetical protein